MEKFTTLEGVAAPLRAINVDTDMIIPKQYLKTIKRTGLGKGLFAELRYDEKGEPHPHFVLHKPPYHQAKILITGENFGCGSSREHAPWALLDFGISCIIAPGFAEIFQGNCFKNGMLPIALPRAEIDALLADAGDPDRATMTVDLEAETIVRADGTALPFRIDPQRRARLLEGLDDIAFALGFEAAIVQHEAQVREQTPWLASMR